MKASLFGLTILLTGCFQAPIQTAGVTTNSSVRLREVKTKLADNGVTTGRINPNSNYPQMVSVPEGSTVTGSSVMIPPGALAVATDIMIEAAMPLATETGMAELAINAVATRAGVSVSVLASEMIDAKTPMTISLPLPAGVGLGSVNDANFVVMYRVAQNEAGRNVAGIIPRSQLTIAGNNVTFMTRFFGAYQVVEFSSPIEAKEIAVVAPAYTQSTVDIRPALELSGLSEIVAQSGRRVQIYGKNFRSTMVLALGGKLVKDLKLASDSVASFIVPTAAAAGRMTLSGEQDGITQSVPLFYLPGAEDLPIITLASTEVCTGTRYYDRTGAVQTGKKNCSEAALCANDGDTGCVVQGPTMAAAVTSGLSAKVLSGNTVAGISGSASAIGAPANCTQTNQTNCVAVDDYPSVDRLYVNSNRANYSSSITIAGMPGSLATCSDDGNSNCITNASYPSADISVLDPASLRSPVKIGGRVGSMLDCTSEGQQACFTTNAWKATNPSSYGPWDIRSGKAIAGINGKIAFYRNGAALSAFNESSIGGATDNPDEADDYDSINDDGGAYGMPTSVPSGGPSALPASESDRPMKFSPDFDTSGNGICDGNESCVYKDQMTGLRWFYTSEVKQGFSAAATTCHTLNKSPLTSGWRLPSQKELQMAYINGILAIAREQSWEYAYDYWSATTAFYDNAKAFSMSLGDGTSDIALKASDTRLVLCVHNP